MLSASPPSAAGRAGPSGVSSHHGGSSMPRSRLGQQAPQRVQSALAVTDTSNVPDPRYRSATEQRMCETIMKLEGSWDDSSNTFRTRESVLQQRSQLMSTMHHTLRVSPNLVYKEQSDDTKFTYPQCPQTLLKTHRTKAADLGVTDPRPENVEQCMTSALERRSRPPQLPASRVGTDDAIEQLESALLEEAYNSISRGGATSVDDDAVSVGGRTTASLYATAAAARNATPAMGGMSPAARRASDDTRLPRTTVDGSPSAAGAAASSSDGPEGEDGYLPDVGAGEKHSYSSLLMELRTTRREAQKKAKKHSALQAILDMEESAELKRTITRMFADPKNAQRISDEEAARREARYKDDRSAQVQQQTRLLAEERAMMDRELALLS